MSSLLEWDLDETEGAMKAAARAADIIPIAQDAEDTARDVLDRFQAQVDSSTTHQGAWADVRAWVSNFVPQEMPQPSSPKTNLSSISRPNRKGKAE
jgi:hypothetical protein